MLPELRNMLQKLFPVVFMIFPIAAFADANDWCSPESFGYFSKSGTRNPNVNGLVWPMFEFQPERQVEVLITRSVDGNNVGLLRKNHVVFFSKQDPSQPDFLPIQATRYAAQSGGSYFHEAAYSLIIFVESGTDVHLEGCWRYIE